MEAAAGRVRSFQALAPTRKSTMSHSHQHTLAALFAHPIAMNVKWIEVEHLIASLGGTVESSQNGRAKLSLNGQHGTFHVPHSHTLDDKDEVMKLRHFLEAAGASPAADKSEKPAAPAVP